mmetsp:Transcript_157858/g.483726  ORF Transcript_157858/g.483726 Transcript_157858/m.483726 type:complete len:296 (-) Transcript_157858:122-1009(-)
MPCARGLGPCLLAWGYLQYALTSVVAVEDISALVQVGAKAASQEQSEVSFADILRPKSASAPVDCGAHPALCRAPFSCAEPETDSAVQLKQQSSSTQLRSSASAKSSRSSARGLYATSDGHANMNWFCGSQEQYAMLECAAGNLSGYAQLKALEKPRGTGDFIHRTIHEVHHDMLAQYCFYMGHCEDKEAVQGMTLAEGENFCDREFGHRAWADFTEKDMEISRSLGGLAGTLKFSMFTNEGVTNLKLGRPSAKVIGKMSCAEGHYHCDVYSCKENYCSDEVYWKKYHHRLPGKN